jgi:hypothetical protein
MHTLDRKSLLSYAHIKAQIILLIVLSIVAAASVALMFVVDLLFPLILALSLSLLLGAFMLWHVIVTRRAILFGDIVVHQWVLDKLHVESAGNCETYFYVFTNGQKILCPPKDEPYAIQRRQFYIVIAQDDKRKFEHVFACDHFQLSQELTSKIKTD